MGGGDFNNAGSEFGVDIAVGHNRNFTSHKGKGQRFADHVLIALVVGMNRHGGVAQQRFGTGGGKLDKAAAVGQRITQMPEKSVLLGILDLGVGNGGLTMGAPVDYALAAIDKSLVVEVYKNLTDGLGAALVHGKSLSRPIAGGAHFSELFGYSAAVYLFPFPCSLKKALAAEIFLGHAFLGHGGHDFCLGGNGSVVGSGQPQGAVSLHSAETGQNVLQGVVKSVTHVELTGDVGRGHNNGVGFLAFIRLGMKIAVFLPKVVKPAFHRLRLIGFV